MLSNLFTWALPVGSISRVFAAASPASYKKFEEMPISDRVDEVRAIVERILNAENVQGAYHYERIQEMLSELPESVGAKTIQSLLNHRIKIVRTETDEYPVFATGTDVQDGKYYIGINPNMGEADALPFIVTHEVSHILHDDMLGLRIVKAAASIAATALSTFVLGWSLFPSLGAVVATNCITHTIYSQKSEKTADDFAIKHCSKQQLERGIAFFERIKALREQGGYSKSLITRIVHPSENSRIAKIRRALGLGGKEKVA